MQAVLVLAAYLFAFFVLFNGIRRTSESLGEARRGFETWTALIVYPAVYAGSSFGAELLNRHFGESLLSLGLALVISVTLALFGVSVAAKRLRPPG
ncbi:MAG: hypothetical protein IT494_03405 [Gammaproteobacteria bacterium]|nr:hypothetical protein [Gammaproteobacteria bacterium]